jgi:hypothetical protein
MNIHSTKLNFEPGGITAMGPPGMKGATWMTGPKKIV